MNNRESINRYNKLLIQYLNDLVNDVGNDTELKQRTFQDVSTRLKEYLNSLEMNIDQNIIILILNQAFVAYSDILKKHFDSSNIHRIDINLATSPTLPREMSTITNNLKVAVENINKIEQYNSLIKKVKDSISYQIRQVNPNYNYYVEQIDQALNNIVVESINTFTISKIESFLKTTLPDLSAFEDKVNQLIDEKMAIQNPNVNVNEERDQFINETMDIEIHEGFENGMVTLLVIDQMGNQQMYYDQEAMEKLTNYNQLFESSRPGKKADTSRWPKANKKKPKNQIPKLDLTNNFLGSARLDNTSQDKNNKTNNNANEENNAFKNFLNKYDNNNDNSQNKIGLPIDDVNKIIMESADFNNLTSPINNKNILDVSNDIFSQNNNTNKVEDDGLKKLRSMMGIKEEDSSQNNLASNSLIDSSMVGNNNFYNDMTPSNNNMPTIQNEPSTIENGNLETPIVPQQIENNDQSSNFLTNFQKRFNNQNDSNVTNDTIIKHDDSTPSNEPFINTHNEFIPQETKHIDEKQPLSDGIGLKVDLPNEENFALPNENNFNFSTTNLPDSSSQVKMFMDKMNASPTNPNVNNSQPTSSFSGGNSFIPNYDNPNEDRDEFIKMTTGLVIEEDKDPDGDVFLRVIEPTGRETIHTGKDAVEMIKNYNRVYLEANPNKTVDTSLIDNYTEH